MKHLPAMNRARATLISVVMPSRSLAAARE
jgi:hypothetical protein